MNRVAVKIIEKNKLTKNKSVRAECRIGEFALHGTQRGDSRFAMLMLCTCAPGDTGVAMQRYAGAQGISGDHQSTG